MFSLSWNTLYLKGPYARFVHAWPSAQSPINPSTFRFLGVKTPYEISKPLDNPFWEKSNPAEEESEKTPLIVDT